MSYRTAEKIIETKGLDAGYIDKSGERILILKDINLTELDVIREGHASTGQVIAFVGRSGRGKSTLFKVLTGLIKPFSGTVEVANMDSPEVGDMKTIHEGDVGFVDQKYTLFRHKTIQQICEYALRKSKLSKEEKSLMIEKYLIDWGLHEHRGKYSCELSGGQRQRTAIIEQLLASKHFMVFDEPFSGLDVGNIENAKKSFQKILNTHEYNTIVFSTHDINIAAELADSIYVIGHPEETKEYSTIVKHYDLKTMGLAWQPFGNGHVNLVNEIKTTLLKS